MKWLWPGKFEPSAIQIVSAFEPSARPRWMHSRLCSIACRRTAGSVWLSDCRTCRRASGRANPETCWSSSRRSRGRAPRPSRTSSAGSSCRSHGMCSETRGVAPVSCWMTAQSSSLSKMLRGSPVAGEAGEARAAGADAPGRDGDREGGGLRLDRCRCRCRGGRASRRARRSRVQRREGGLVLLPDESSRSSPCHRPPQHSVLCRPDPAIHRRSRSRRHDDPSPDAPGSARQWGRDLAASQDRL